MSVGRCRSGACPQTCAAGVRCSWCWGVCTRTCAQIKGGGEGAGSGANLHPERRPGAGGDRGGGRNRGGSTWRPEGEMSRPGRTKVKHQGEMAWRVSSPGRSEGEGNGRGRDRQPLGLKPEPLTGLSSTGRSEGEGQGRVRRPRQRRGALTMAPEQRPWLERRRKPRGACARGPRKSLRGIGEVCGSGCARSSDAGRTDALHRSEGVGHGRRV